VADAVGCAVSDGSGDSDGHVSGMEPYDVVTYVAVRLPNVNDQANGARTEVPKADTDMNRRSPGCKCASLTVTLAGSTYPLLHTALSAHATTPRGV
jgi:hypothetical protein